MTTACEVIACARTLIGVRFTHQGRSREGLDCLGFLIHIAQDLCLQFGGQSALDLDVPSYGARPDALLLKEKLDALLTPIALGALQPADIVLLRIDGVPRHLALISDYPIADELGMIHAYAPARAVVEHRYDPEWKRATYAAYRLPHLM